VFGPRMKDEGGEGTRKPLRVMDSLVEEGGRKRGISLTEFERERE
jgi:hypothetical protein